MKRSHQTTYVPAGVPAGLALAALLAACGCASTDSGTEPGPPVGVALEEHEQIDAPEEAAAPPPREFPYVMIEGEPMFTVVPQDGILAIDDPVFVSAAEAEAFMQANETVLGVVGKDGTAKCYSAWQLDSHEIVNDVLDGLPIAATW